VTTPELAVDTVSIVIKGKFDPQKLAVQELSEQGLIPRDQLTQATQRISTSDLSLLETETFRFVANRDLIQLTAKDAYEFQSSRDLAVNILQLISGDAPSVMGINRDVHFAAATVKAWHSVGDTFAPKGVWDGTLELAGMASLILHARRDDLYEGYRQVTLQPSSTVTHGIFVGHNDHYTLAMMDAILVSREQLASIARKPPEPNPEKLAVAVRILNTEWEKSMSRALEVVDRVAQEAE
jgi:hypothetical protein